MADIPKSIINASGINSATINSYAVYVPITSGIKGANRAYAEFSTEMLGAFDVSITPIFVSAKGASGVYSQITSGLVGVHGVGADPVSIRLKGAAKQYNGIDLSATGANRVYVAVEAGAAGAFAVSPQPVEMAIKGAFAAKYDPVTMGVKGASTIGYESINAGITGACTLGYDPVNNRLKGAARHSSPVTLSLKGRYRLAGDSEGYELYRGVDGEVDYSSPWESFSTLPHECAVLDFDHTYRFVLRYRNAYGLASENIDYWTLTLDESGNQVVTPPSAPIAVSISPAAAGTVNVKAQYRYPTDGDNQANQWLIYLATGVSVPDPDVDTPITVTMAKSDGIARLNYTSTAYADGTTVTVLVRTYRSSETAESTNTTNYSTTAAIDGPSKPTGSIH